MRDHAPVGSAMPSDEHLGPSAVPPSFREAVKTWAVIGLLGFGGPAGQIALMHRMLVEQRKWIDDARFMHALNFCMLLPGPEAQQLAIYVGWLLHGVRGGLVAGTLFVVPGALVMLGLSIAYVTLGHLAAAAGFLLGLKAAVVGVVADALVRIGRRALKSRSLVLVAVLSFVAIAVLRVPFPVIVAVAGLAGAVAARWRKAGETEAPAMLAPLERGAGLRALRTLAIGLAAWAAPVLLVAWAFGGEGAYVDVSLFFSKAAVVTFGGAYAVLAYVAQEAVAVHGWLLPGEMVDGLGLAETTPGPLVLVLQFVGFLAAWRDPAGLHPLLAGTLGAGLTAWVTFVPCFLWIFLAAPHVERLRSRPAVRSALEAITAAVVGVIANLALWFTLHVVFAEVREMRLGPLRLEVPDPASLRPEALALALLATYLLVRAKVPLLAVLLGCVVAGLVGSPWLS